MNGNYLQRLKATNFMETNSWLFNDVVVDMLAAMNIAWTPDLVSSVGENCIKVLVSSLWYIDPCHKQFVERSIHLLSVLDQLGGIRLESEEREEASAFIRWADIAIGTLDTTPQSAMAVQTFQTAS